MSAYKSEDTQLVFGNETTLGTSVTPDHHVGGVDDSATPPDPEQEWLVRRYIGQDREPGALHQGIRSYEGGSIPFVVWDGKPFAWLLGVDSVTADSKLDSSGSTISSTGDTLHTITGKMDGKPPTKTMEATYYGRDGGNDLVRTFAGVAPNSGEITLDAEGSLDTSLSLWATGVTHGDSDTAVALPSRSPLMFHDIQADLSLFGSTFAELTEMTLEVENNFQAGRYVESTDGVDPSTIHYGNLDYTFSPTIEITDDTIYDELVNLTNGEFAANIQLENADGYQVRFEMTGCRLENAPHEIPGDAEPIPVEASVLPQGLTVKVTDPNETTAYV